MSETSVINSASSKRLDFVPSNVIPLLKVSLKNFTSDDRLAIASNKKLAVLNSKNPMHVKVLHRISGKVLDIPDLHKSAIVDIAALDYDASVFVTLAKGGEASVLAVGENADGELTYESKVVQFPEDMLRVVVATVAGTSHQESEKLAHKELFGLSVNGTVHVLDVDSNKTRMLLSKSTTFKVPFLSFNPETRLLASPGGRGTVTLTFVDSGRAAIEKTWAPHSNDDLTSLTLLPKISVAHGTLIVSCSDDNSDIRLWALKDGIVTLQQSLLIAGTTAEDASPPRCVSLDPSGDYVHFASRSNSDPSLVVLEVDTTRGRFRRWTDWNLLSGAVAFAGILRKRKQGTNVIVESAAVVRTDEKVSMVILDSEKLTGAPNIGGEGGASGAASKTTPSVLKWFGNSPAPSAPAPREGAAVVSSSIDRSKEGGSSGGPTAAVVEKQALTVLQRQNAAVATTLSAIDEQVVALQGLATSSLKTLQSQQARDAARTAGHDSAKRSSFRPAGGAAAAGAGGITPQTLEVVHSFAGGVKTSIRESTTQCVAAALDKHLPHATQRGMDNAEAAEKSNSAMPKLMSTEAAQQFQAAIDKAFAAQQKNFKSDFGSTARSTIMAVSGAKTVAEGGVARFKQYMDTLKKEMQGLHADIAAVRAAGVATSVAEPITEEKLMAMLNAGDWKAAFAAAVEAGNTDLLLNMLETECVVTSRELITDPDTLPFPLCIAILKQLSHDMRARLGAVPLRVAWISEFLMNWDPRLQQLTSEQSEDGKLMRMSANDFAQIADNLATVNVRGEIDTTTRRSIHVAVKVLKSLYTQ